MTREEKNKQIALSNKETRERRKTQTALVFECGIRNERRNRKSGALSHCFGILREAKWMKNDVLHQMNEEHVKISQMKDKDFKVIRHLDKDKNSIESIPEYLTSSMRLGVLTDMKWNLSSLRALKKKGMKVGRLKYESEHKSITLLQYGITHWLTGPNSIHILGFKSDIRVAGLRQLRNLEKNGIEYEVSVARLRKDGSKLFFDLTVYVDTEKYNAFLELKRQKRQKTLLEKDKNKVLHDMNALDLGCETSVTDAYGNKYNVQVEETERLKRLQRKFSRQEKGSNNQYRTRLLIQKEYMKLKNKRDAAAIELTTEILTVNDIVAMQDEQVSNWKRKRKVKKKDSTVVKRKGSGKKVQHGILGRLKKRLGASKRVHVMSKWVPTTKLCIKCGHVYKDISLSERQFVCPHCGQPDGDRDVHSAKNMLWLYQNMRDIIGLDGSEFKREDFDEGLAARFSVAERKRSASVDQDARETILG